MGSATNLTPKDRLKGLGKALAESARVWILTHDNPDPDSMAASAVLLRVVRDYFRLEAGITYGGIIGRADNRLLAEMLGVPMWHVESITAGPRDCFVCVDTQPSFATHSLPVGGKVAAVIDHHPAEAAVDVPFADVRPWRGSVAAILTEYLLAAGLELTTQVATVVAFAIVSETEDFGRAASDEDVRVYMRILSHVDHRMLGQLRHPKIERSFFRTLARALKAAKVCRDVVACEIGPVNTPDEVPEVADFLNSMAGARWVLCMGRFQSRLLISLRTSDSQGGAAHLLMSSVANIGSAGGHDMFAGGQVPLKRGADSSEICRNVTQGVLAALGYDTNSTWEPLLNGS